MIYFARMLDKIRLHARGELRADCHANLGLRMGGDGLCCAFLRVAYADLKTRVLGGGTDEEILDWCFQQGRKPSEVDLLVWNEFGRKLGWNDRATPILEKLKAESGLAGRNDIVTLFDYTDVDEGRKP
jgi:gluconokinase